MARSGTGREQVWGHRAGRRRIAAFSIAHAERSAVPAVVVSIGLLCSPPSECLAQTKRPQPAPADACPDNRRGDQQKLAEAERVADYYREFAESTQKELLACLARSAPSHALESLTTKLEPPAKKSATVVDQPPPPTSPPADVAGHAREVCGLVLPAGSGAPGTKDTILVASKQRGVIDQELRLPDAKPADVETIDADVCFAPLSGGYVLVSPPGRAGQVTAIIPDEDSQLGRWLVSAVSSANRVRLAPSSECNALLDALSARGDTSDAAWVEEGNGLSRCERSATGDVHVDSTKINGYSGVIIVKVKHD